MGWWRLGSRTGEPTGRFCLESDEGRWVPGRIRFSGNGRVDGEVLGSTRGDEARSRAVGEEV